MDFDESAWPLLVVTTPPIFGPEAVEALKERFEAYFRREQRYALVFDTRPVVRLPDALCRRALFEWINSSTVRECTARYNVGSALVVASQLARYGITVVNWVWRPPSPQQAVPTMPEAIDWCSRRLSAEGIALRPRLTGLRSGKAG